MVIVAVAIGLKRYGDSRALPLQALQGTGIGSLDFDLTPALGTGRRDWRLRNGHGPYEVAARTDDLNQSCLRHHRGSLLIPPASLSQSSLSLSREAGEPHAHPSSPGSSSSVLPITRGPSRPIPREPRQSSRSSCESRIAFSVGMLCRWDATHNGK
jgi:hypothetical protein